MLFGLDERWTSIHLLFFDCSLYHMGFVTSVKKAHYPTMNKILNDCLLDDHTCLCAFKCNLHSYFMLI